MGEQRTANRESYFPRYKFVLCRECKRPMSAPADYVKPMCSCAEQQQPGGIFSETDEVPGHE